MTLDENTGMMTTPEGYSAQYRCLEEMFAEEGIRMGIRCEDGIRGAYLHSIVLTFPSPTGAGNEYCLVYPYEPHKRGSFAVTLDRIAELHQSLRPTRAAG